MDNDIAFIFVERDIKIIEAEALIGTLAENIQDALECGGILPHIIHRVLDFVAGVDPGGGKLACFLAGDEAFGHAGLDFKNLMRLEMQYAAFEAAQIDR